jgi:hypothetical protein
MRILGTLSCLFADLINEMFRPKPNIYVKKAALIFFIANEDVRRRNAHLDFKIYFACSPTLHLFHLFSFNSFKKSINEWS